MSNSLLAYLYPRIKGSQEDVATLALTHILTQSDVLNAELTKQLCSRLQVEKQHLAYSPQETGSNKERPDIVGKDKNGVERIIIEAKFFAALTENQPNEYLNRLKGTPQAGLIILCPKSRIVSLWLQLLDLVSARNPEVFDERCVSVDGVHMSIISWKELLDFLDKTAADADQGMLSDVRQLAGYCREIENTSFVPFKAEDFGADIAKSIDRYYMVVDSVIAELMKLKAYHPTTKGLRATPQWNGYTRYIRFGAYGIGVYFDRMLWKKETSVCTPFWLSINNEMWEQTDRIRQNILMLPAFETEKDKNGHLFIALKASVAKTQEEIAQELAGQIKDIIDEFDKNIV